MDDAEAQTPELDTSPSKKPDACYNLVLDLATISLLRGDSMFYDMVVRYLEAEGHLKDRTMDDPLAS